MDKMSTTLINRNFKIKVSGNGLNTLVGVSGLSALIGDELVYKLAIRAFASQHDNTHCRLRRGLKISFYGK